MPNALYTVQSGGAPLASDVNQFAGLLNGTLDLGPITFAAPISAPVVTGVTVAVVAGTALGIGTYEYYFTYVAGQKKTNGTFIYAGETNASSAISITTTSGNQAVTFSNLPTSWPSTAMALRIYRTAVGGSTPEIVTTLNTPQSSYTDTTADASLLNVQPPTTNTTGTYLSGVTLESATLNSPTINSPSFPGGITLSDPTITGATVSGTFSGSATWVSPQTFSGGFESQAIPLAASTDLDTVVNSGFYRLDNSNTNAPTGVDYGQLIVSRGADTIFQIVTGFNDNEYYMRQASGIGSTPAWQPWRRVWHDGNQQAVGTANSPTFAGLLVNGGLTLQGGNGSIFSTESLELQIDSRTTNLTYTNGQLTQVQVVDPSNSNAVVSTITLAYTNGQLTTVTEVAGGRTITTTLTYTNGQLTSVTKAVQ